VTVKGVTEKAGVIKTVITIRTCIFFKICIVLPVNEAYSVNDTMPTILITGLTGFIGSYLTETFVEAYVPVKSCTVQSLTSVGATRSAELPEAKRKPTPGISDILSSPLRWIG
jgi:hypothetical protein